MVKKYWDKKVVIFLKLDKELFFILYYVYDKVGKSFVDFCLKLKFLMIIVRVIVM